MKKLYLIISSVVLLTGCYQGVVTPIVPKMKEVAPTSLSWEDIKHNGTKGHFLMQHEWQYVQSELIKKGMKANMCIKIMNGFSE